MKFSVKDFFSTCDQIRSLLRIWSHLLKKSFMENFIFCALYGQSSFSGYMLKRIEISAVPLFQPVRDETSSSPDNINLFKVTKETLKKGVKYVQY